MWRSAQNVRKWCWVRVDGKGERRGMGDGGKLKQVFQPGVFIYNNNFGLQYNSKNPILLMLFYQPFLGAQECFYMFCWPRGAIEPPVSGQSSEQQLKKAEQGEGTILSVSEEGEQRIILTREDLLSEGHQSAKKPWSKEEDRLLLKLCNNEEAKFSDIALRIPGRNAKMCYSRFRRLSHHTRQGWKPEQDQRLLQLVSQYGENEWKNLSAFFEGRTYKQLKEHFVNYLRPGLEKGEWKVEEELELIRLINNHGKNWNIIEGGLPGRSRNQIKNRFFGRISRLNRKKMEVLGLCQR